VRHLCLLFAANTDSHQVNTDQLENSKREIVSTNFISSHTPSTALHKGIIGGGSNGIVAGTKSSLSTAAKMRCC
jgi:hypothetical protein